MFIANNADGKRISIEKATKSEQHFCPVCGKPLIIKATNSLAVHTHFAHFHKCDDDWNYDMSKWHYAWQQKFPENCREVIIKKDGEKHRADVLINNTVIEFQHSPIKGEEIKKRNDFYLSLGHNVVWVFDANGKIENLYEDTIDPLMCKQNILYWKRPKQEFSQFAKQIPKNIKIYFQYKIPNTESDIILSLTKLNSENFTFDKTKQYLFQSNFLKEYGIKLHNELSISELILYNKLQEDLEIFNKSKTINTHDKFLKKQTRHYTVPRYKRNWYL